MMLVSVFHFIVVILVSARACDNCDSFSTEENCDSSDFCFWNSRPAHCSNVTAFLSDHPCSSFNQADCKNWCQWETEGEDHCAEISNPCSYSTKEECDVNEWCFWDSNTGHTCSGISKICPSIIEKEECIGPFCNWVTEGEDHCVEIPDSCSSCTDKENCQLKKGCEWVTDGEDRCGNVCTNGGCSSCLSQTSCEKYGNCKWVEGYCGPVYCNDCSSCLWQTACEISEFCLEYCSSSSNVDEALKGKLGESKKVEQSQSRYSNFCGCGYEEYCEMNCTKCEWIDGKCSLSSSKLNKIYFYFVFLIFFLGFL